MQNIFKEIDFTFFFPRDSQFRLQTAITYIKYYRSTKRKNISLIRFINSRYEIWKVGDRDSMEETGGHKGPSRGLLFRDCVTENGPRAIQPMKEEFIIIALFIFQLSHGSSTNHDPSLILSTTIVRLIGVRKKLDKLSW